MTATETKTMNRIAIYETDSERIAREASYDILGPSKPPSDAVARARAAIAREDADRMISKAEAAELTAWKWAKNEQGFTGDYAAWKALPAAEREEYETGAAGIPT